MERGYGRRLKDRLKAASRPVNPAHVYRTLREDIRRVKEARSLKDRDIYEAKAAESAVRLKFAASVAVCEVFATYMCAPIAGTIAQYASGSAYNGIAGTILGDYIPSVVSFAVLWPILNSGYYAESSGTAAGRLKAMSKDMLPFYKAGLVAAVPSYIISAALSSGAIALTSHYSQGAADRIPFPIMAEALNVVVAEAAYLALLFGLTERNIKAVSQRYDAYLERSYGTRQEEGAGEGA